MRIEVWVEDFRGVGFRKPLSDLRSELEHLFHRKRAPIDFLPERFPVDKLQGEKQDSLRFLHRVEGDDVGMIQRRDRLRLAMEALPPIGIRSELRRKDFERDLAGELRS